MGDQDDEDRRAILSRRNRLIALALTGLTSTAGCYDSHGVAEGDATVIPMRDSGPGVCLGAPFDAGEPLPCLEPLIDAGGPFPCLAPLPDAGPGVCLSAPFDAGPSVCLDIDIRDAGPEPTDAGAPTPCLTII